MSHSLQQPEPTTRHRSLATGSLGRSVHGGLFFLFAIELFLFGMVLWAYLVNRSLFPNSTGDIAAPIWGLIALGAGVWGTWYLNQSRKAAAGWNIEHSRNLLTIAVASGAVLLGVLILNIAKPIVSGPVVMDIRSHFTATADGQSKPTSATVTAGDAARGKQWFSASCVTCHGPTGEGVNNAAPSLRESEFLKTADEAAIASVIRDGRPVTDPANKTGKAMPAKGGNPFLDESKIADLVAFLKDLDSQFGDSKSSSPTMKVSTDLDSVRNQLEGQPAKTVRKWTLEDLASLEIPSDEETVAVGMQAFVKATCNKCHMTEVAGQELGPTLDQIVSTYSRDKLLKHIVDPSAEINEKYQSTNFLLLDGRMVSGIVVEETEEEIKVMTDLLKPEELTTFLIDDIDDQFESTVSAMPTGLVDVLTEEQIAALVAYVDAAGKQMAATNAPQLHRWVVPAVARESTPAALATSTAVPAKPISQLVRSRTQSRYTGTLTGLFLTASAVLAMHFLWVIGLGTAIILHRELQLSFSRQVRLSQQAYLFWAIGIAWLLVWLLLFFWVG